jgi:hypothetical protein
MTKKLEGETAVITGGTEGIGLATFRAATLGTLVLTSLLTSVLLYRFRGAPEGASVEPFRISSQHLVVELFCSRGLSGEFLKIKDVLPGLSDHPWTVVIILDILVAGDDNTWLERLHLVQC